MIKTHNKSLERMAEKHHRSARALNWNKKMKKILIFSIIVFFSIISSNVYCKESDAKLSKEEILTIALNKAYPGRQLKYRPGYSINGVEIIYEENNEILDRYLKLMEYYPSVTERDLQGVFFKDTNSGSNEHLVIGVDRNTGETPASIRFYKDSYKNKMNNYKFLSLFLLGLFFILYLILQTPRLLGLVFGLIPISLGALLFSSLTPYGTDGIGTTLISIIINFPSSIVLVSLPFVGYYLMFIVGGLQYYFIGFYLGKKMQKNKRMNIN
jgi:hypothetical protein